MRALGIGSQGEGVGRNVDIYAWIKKGKERVHVSFSGFVALLEYTTTLAYHAHLIRRETSKLLWSCAVAASLLFTNKLDCVPG